MTMMRRMIKLHAHKTALKCNEGDDGGMMVIRMKVIMVEEANFVNVNNKRKMATKGN